ncbi:MAG: hypothetical protein ABF461_08395 [Zymomonas mobilis subsp. pomaceae]|uniref:Uncharacterized protein n=1 Tax=Zymomonas mobilis subsp. pomaceae (strain ATCC 29192 / DSM 22645 / JCM 10191 / CCUG 17912 / NBRC 13757 / NCIMB 11200 / NRRL B-4491 / Barker I) TaxID=579138 RepID=F8EUT2_ZYMMT|nr:hypothetical protein [Zymomonas mobilis]AEI38228.1 hypothetical protein Zymop_1338 [Zymomonas mobilis subsp. pomaceae ATCC 29192]MDX5947918.1 hypothetical protein [Zymomonas mobilis subsp. pomaceae]GEB89979.1 hypothetical protein ZMO02_16160 [Zymomonas mobilis subsp. pomaceae]
MRILSKLFFNVPVLIIRTVIPFIATVVSAKEPTSLKMLLAINYRAEEKENKDVTVGTSNNEEIAGKTFSADVSPSSAVSTLRNDTSSQTPPSDKSNRIAFTLSPDRLRDKMEQATKLTHENNCPASLALLDPIIPSLKGHERVAAQLLRIPCLATLGYDTQIPTTYEDIKAIEPENGAVISVGILIALASDDFSAAGERLLLLTDKDPARVDHFETDMVQAILNQNNTPNRQALWQKLVLGLVHSSWGISAGPDVRDSLIKKAISVYLKKHQVEDAADFLSEINDPERLIEMAISRDYEAIWPEIERHLGVHSQEKITQFSSFWLRALSDQPDNPLFIDQSIHAFTLSGRFEDAVRLGESFQIISDSNEITIKGIVAATNAQLALTTSGKISAPIFRLQQISMLDPARNPEVLHADVKLAEWLNQSGRYYEARTLSEKMLSNLDLSLTSKEIAWFQRSAVCSMMQLGQRAQAGQMAIEMVQSHLNNAQAVVEALFCAGKPKEAVNFTLQALQNPLQSDSLLKVLQPTGVFSEVRPPQLQHFWVKLYEIPAVERAFSKTGRRLPERLRVQENVALPLLMHNSLPTIIS